MQQPSLVLATLRAALPRLLQRSALLPAAVAVAGVIGIVVYFQVPSDVQDVEFVVYGALAAIALVYGAIRHLPARLRLPWYLIAISQAAFSAGDGVLNFYSRFTGHEAPFPSAGDIAYIAGYPFMTLGIYLLVRKIQSAEGFFVYVDSALITGALALVQWVFMIEPYTHHVEESVAGRIVLMLYPAVDVLLIAVLARFFVTSAWRTPAYALLVPAVIFLIAGDEVYVQNIDGYVGGQWSDAFWLLSYLLLALTALTPSIRRLSRATILDITPRLSPARVALLTLALIAAPISQLIKISDDNDALEYLIAGAAAALALLVLIRIVGLVNGVQSLRIAERQAREEVEAARARLAEQNEQLILADLMKDEFIGMISHDLRTPLVSATGFLELLSDGDAGELNDEQRRYVGFIQRASDRLLRQIEDLLVAASLQAGRFSMEHDVISLADVATEAVETQGQVAASKGVELRLDVQRAPQVEADALRLAQVVDNLLSNAIKFTPRHGHVEVRVFGDSNSSKAVLEVADSGMGIPEGEQSALFERFFRTSEAVEQRIPGTGLGLYIVKSLVEAHGGNVTLRSVAGKGTTFRVELPAAGAQPAGGR